MRHSEERMRWPRRAALQRRDTGTGKHCLDRINPATLSPFLKFSGDITTDVFQHLLVTLTLCIHNCMHDIVEWRLQLADASWQVNDFHFDAFSHPDPFFSWIHVLEIFFLSLVLMAHFKWMVIIHFSSNVQGAVQWIFCRKNEGMTWAKAKTHTVVRWHYSATVHFSPT